MDFVSSDFQVCGRGGSGSVRVRLSLLEGHHTGKLTVEQGRSPCNPYPTPLYMCNTEPL